jgi:hypothetical protein
MPRPPVRRPSTRSLSRTARPAVEPLEARQLLAADADRFLGQVYRDLLGREPDAAGLSAWTDRLDRGADRPAVVGEVLDSAEFRQRQLTDLYRPLRREPDPFGRAAFAAAFKRGAGWEGVQAAVLGSPEYYQAIAGGTDAGFVTALYANLLGRAPDPFGQSVFTAALAAGATRHDVAAAVAGSPEARARVVSGFYVNYLGRDPEPAGLAAWLGRVREQDTTRVALAGVLASEEYFARLQPAAAPCLPF